MNLNASLDDLGTHVGITVVAGSAGRHTCPVNAQDTLSNRGPSTHDLDPWPLQLEITRSSPRNTGA